MSDSNKGETITQKKGILTSSVGLNVSRVDGVVTYVINLDESFDLSNIKILVKLGDVEVYKVNTGVSQENIKAIIDNNEGGITKPKK